MAGDRIAAMTLQTKASVAVCCTTQVGSAALNGPMAGGVCACGSSTVVSFGVVWGQNSLQ